VAWDSSAPGESGTAHYTSESWDQWANCCMLGIILAAPFIIDFSLACHYLLLLWPRSAQANVAS